jgi:uracil-DNA glycosylase
VRWGSAVRFWAGVKGRAQELFDMPVRPGIDYALTEVVHCKTRSEVGVPEAKFVCANRYLVRVLACSAARVIVVLGVAALPGVQRVFLEAGIGRVVFGPLALAGHERYVAYLPHPNAFESKTFARLYPGELPRLGRYLGQQEEPDDS